MFIATYLLACPQEPTAGKDDNSSSQVQESKRTKRIKMAVTEGDTDPSEAVIGDGTTLDQGARSKQAFVTDNTEDAPEKDAPEKDQSKKEEGETDESKEDDPKKDDTSPPLPEEAPPFEDDWLPLNDGWARLWDTQSNWWYYQNSYSGTTQWENPRDPADPYGHYKYSQAANSYAGDSANKESETVKSTPNYKGYNPAIHGNYDPNADYAVEARKQEEEAAAAAAAAAQAASYAYYGYGQGSGTHDQQYPAQATFNRFTGRFQAAEETPDKYSDANKSRRQMNAFFDVDAAANSHDGRSLKEERRNQKVTRKLMDKWTKKKADRKWANKTGWLRD
ncbi:hypothetical protein EJ04DRAFT_512324 [Polyplosphaeria fusca]|uniref:WW domain-containing protein n=1 Tax=Polyplosphaeria fusca TaxID=682080 RepID=A0A9P4R177_9PLEO|nr:hypothetical protein EJ04DRAFT_512324 [Polyplosphaeria fusca]